MRKKFFETLLELARNDERIALVVGDVGYSFVEPFIQEFPDRYINVGVAEQNMIGISAGLSLSGKVVFCYSIANFPTVRCLEQIRNDVCYHNANVKIVSTGGGLGYGSLGVTHHSTEDIALMRALPNMKVVAPGDPIESALAGRHIASTPGPFYLRLTRGPDAVVHRTSPPFEIGKAITVREGNDVTLISTGGMLDNAVQAADMLGRDGVSTRVLSMHTLKPFDTDAVRLAAREAKAIVSIEEHSSIGGLGSAVSETLAEINKHPALVRISIRDPFTKVVGGQKYLQRVHGLTPEAIYGKAKEALLKSTAAN